MFPDISAVIPQPNPFVWIKQSKQFLIWLLEEKWYEILDNSSIFDENISNSISSQ